MPVYLDIANLIFDKQALEKKYKGGCTQFRVDWKVGENDTSQEDDELICLSRMNLDEFDIDRLIEAGLSYDDEQEQSEDFIAITRYGGALWETTWLSYNATYAWHVNCQQWQKEKALFLSEEMAMEEISKLLDEGVEVFQTIRSRGLDVSDEKKIGSMKLNYTRLLKSILPILVGIFVGCFYLFTINILFQRSVEKKPDYKEILVENYFDTPSIANPGGGGKYLSEEIVYNDSKTQFINELNHNYLVHFMLFGVLLYSLLDITLPENDKNPLRWEI